MRRQTKRQKAEQAAVQAERDRNRRYELYDLICADGGDDGMMAELLRLEAKEGIAPCGACGRPAGLSHKDDCPLK